MKKIWLWMCCHILSDHDWTNNAKEGIPPTPQETAAGFLGFRSYAAMYCKRCGHYSALSI